MKVISTPVGLRLATLAMIFCVPLAALQVALGARVPWWRLPHQDMAISAGVVFLVVLVLRWGILQGYKWVFQLSVFFAALWAASGAMLALRYKLPSIGFFSVFLLLYFTVTFFWIWKELTRSYWDPAMKWYQGHPRPISGLQCELRQGEVTAHCRVGRIDHEGAILFLPPKIGSLPTAVLKPKKVSELTFSFRDKRFQCQATPIRELHHKSGAGFHFKNVSPDASKEIGQFIESLRGEGYVE